MMLADRVEGDVFDEHHLAMMVTGHGHEDVAVVCAEAGEDVFVHLGDPARRAEQPGALGIFADALEDESNPGLDLGVIHAAGRRRLRWSRG